MAVVIDPVELLALKKLALICGALAQSLNDRSAAREQRALTSVLVDVIHRAEVANAKQQAEARVAEVDRADRERVEIGAGERAPA